MSYKTDRLVDLFPDPYGTRETASLLFKILDSVAAELMTGDEQVKRLLKSHWVRYASADALDKLGAVFGITRRTLRTGEPEKDTAFRLRLQTTVPLFTGGGTRQAVLGAVRSALGLPYNLDQLKLPPQYDALRRDIENLVVLREFSPTSERVLGTSNLVVQLTPRVSAAQLVLTLNAATISASSPRIEWTFDRSARNLSLTRLDNNRGLRSVGRFLAQAGNTIVFTSRSNGILSAVLDGRDVSGSFVNLDGTSPALLPDVPATPSDWRFRATSGVFDTSMFDSGDSFDLPVFSVIISRVRLQPLTFDVEVPYFIREAVAELKERHGFPGELFVFEGIPLERIQEVVDQSRAAGVRGSVQFSLTFFERHNQNEAFSGRATHAAAENADSRDSLLVANTNDQNESHDISERLTLAGVFDISRFNGPFGFVG